MEEDKLRSILGKNIKFFRLRRHFSQADLAEKANISITFLSNIERGNNYPQAGTLCNIANALGIEVWELFKEENTSDEQNAIINRISQDYKKQVNIALETVHKNYTNVT
ncbi:MAG: helix-turn-helix domain-containing protein [Treponema sp.]|jgi:transcriptional regulator with XRE-family HTH domain|nr:helix-turn-helix domain-containing protein [Treponema sp.]